MILCHERSYIYAALYNGNQCTCLNPLEYKKLDILPSEACDVPCVENDELTCGGKAAASVFLAVASSIVSSDEGVAALKGRLDYCQFTLV